MASTRTATDTMKAFVIKGVWEVGVVEKSVPETGPNEAMVRTTAALVCQSDVHTVKGAIPVKLNRTLGHESVGVVHSLGSAVESLSEGDRVVVGGPHADDDARVRLHEIEQAFALMQNKEDGIIKPLIRFD